MGHYSSLPVLDASSAANPPEFGTVHAKAVSSFPNQDGANDSNFKFQNHDSSDSKERG